MNAWKRYSSRSQAHGATRRDTALKQECRWLNTYLSSSLSSHPVVLDGLESEVIILDSDNLNIKTICTYPGQTIRNGGMVVWNDHYWLITEVDANDEVYAKGIMQQCNYLLKWINQRGEVIERWSIVEDGTKLKHICRCAIVWRIGNGT